MPTRVAHARDVVGGPRKRPRRSRPGRQRRMNIVAIVTNAAVCRRENQQEIIRRSCTRPERRRRLDSRLRYSQGHAFRQVTPGCCGPGSAGSRRGFSNGASRGCFQTLHRPVCVDDPAKSRATLGKRDHRCVRAARFPPNNTRAQHLLAHPRFQFDGDRPCVATPGQTVRHPALDIAQPAHQAAHRRARNRIGRGPDGISRRPAVEKLGLFRPFPAKRHVRECWSCRPSRTGCWLGFGCEKLAFEQHRRGAHALRTDASGPQHMMKKRDVVPTGKLRPVRGLRVRPDLLPRRQQIPLRGRLAQQPTPSIAGRTLTLGLPQRGRTAKCRRLAPAQRRTSCSRRCRSGRSL